MGLKPKGMEKTPLWFGTLVHMALADWYLPGVKRGPHPAETFAKLAGEALHSVKVADATEEAMAEYVDGKELGIAMLEGYVKLYGTDPQWSFISTEQTFQLEVPWPKDDRQLIWEVTDGQILLTYAGSFDGVYRDLETGRIELLETKTAKAIQTSHLPLDDQAGSYWAVASHVLAKQGLIKPGERISGINYNFLRKAFPDLRPRDAEGYATNKPLKAHYVTALADRPGCGNAKQLGAMKLDDLAALAKQKRIAITGDRSKAQPTQLFLRYMENRTSAERRTQLSRIQNEAILMQAHRERLLPLIKNPTRDCTWDCDYAQLCELDERGGDTASHIEAAFRVADPYADHRKSTDE